MEPKEPVQAPTTQPSLPSQPTYTPTPSSHSKLSIILLTFITLLSLGGLVYFYLQNQSLKQQLETKLSVIPNATTSPIPLPSPNNEVPTNWQTHTSPSKPVTTIQYPADWKIDETYVTDDSGNYLFSYTVSKGQYSITFSFPAGFGPGVCIFKDQPEFSQDLEPNPVSTKCPGDFVEIKSPTSTFRRLATPPKKIEDGIIPEWGIYTRDNNGNYVTVPPIAYKVPDNPDTTQIKIMDQILSTFTPQK